MFLYRKKYWATHTWLPKGEMLQLCQSVCKGSDRCAPGEKHKDSSKEPQVGETEGKVTKANVR